MNFREQLINENEEMAAKSKAEQAESKELANRPIPPEEMEKLTAQMAENIRNSLRDLVRSNSFTYGYHKIFKHKKVNCRYEVFDTLELMPPQQVSTGDVYRPYWMLPDSNHFKISEVNGDVKKLHCSTLHLEQLMNSVKKVMQNDGVSFVWDINKRKAYGQTRTFVHYEAFLKCDSEGNVI